MLKHDAATLIMNQGKGEKVVSPFQFNLNSPNRKNTKLTNFVYYTTQIKLKLFLKTAFLHTQINWF